jgi:dsRNA-specific ribonuclease
MDGALGTAVQAPVKDRGAAAAAVLEERIGYAFANRELLDTALTHSSAVNNAMASYQRLEFLGDRVLALVISEMLIEAFPRAAEGELAQRLTALVRNEACDEAGAGLCSLRRLSHPSSIRPGRPAQRRRRPVRPRGGSGRRHGSPTAPRP